MQERVFKRRPVGAPRRRRGNRKCESSRDMARAGRAGWGRVLTFDMRCPPRMLHTCILYMPQSTAGGDGERRTKKQEGRKGRGVYFSLCGFSQTTCNLELNKPSCTRADRHRSNIEVSQNPAARDQRRAGVGCERVQSSHGSPAPFCAQVPGRSDGRCRECRGHGRSPAGLGPRRNGVIEKKAAGALLANFSLQSESCREGAFAIWAFAI